jgi:squalene-hopene/tetraprenyl-beta-curcumene cyclase
MKGRQQISPHMRRQARWCLALALAAGTFVPRALAIDEAHKKKGEEMAARAIGYLKGQQDSKTGGWAVPPAGADGKPGAPAYPAITGLIINGMAMEPGLSKPGAMDPALASGVKYLLAMQQPDGGIYDRILPSYNTSICISALAQVKTPESAAAVRRATAFLKTLQWSEDAATEGAAGKEVKRATKDDPFYGGVGYGRSGRPDMSNLAFFVQAMHDAEVPESDPAFQRALVFLQRVQMDGRINDQPYATGSHQGGFIYSTGEGGDKKGAGQSMAGLIEESMDDGTKVSRLRAYGTMTYKGFKSYIYAHLSKDDPRVTAAMDWIRRHYTLAENPGVGADGTYYYLVTFARAMDAWGAETLDVWPLRAPGAETKAPAGGPEPAPAEPAPSGPAQARDWANDLIDRLAELQNADGSFRSVDDRWMESNPVLITAYGLIALEHAVR